MQVIADHARAATFLITDGVTPSNEWRGYVLRRIMRRAMRHGRMLGLNEPFLWDMTRGVVALMGDAYPEIREAQARVAETVRQEEERFAETLDLGMAADPRKSWRRRRGPRRSSTAASCSRSTTPTGSRPIWPRKCSRTPAGRSPPRPIGVFESEMEAQRERARAGASFGAADTGEPSVAIYQRLSTELAKPQFLGYASLAAPARILALVADGQRRREARQGETVEIILDRTPAYAESGGQQGDTGSVIGREGQGQIQDTYYRGSQLIVHRVAVTQGQLREGEEVAVSVESRRRQGLRQHHTGTHLLHAALRKVLGTHVAQAGSLVAPDHLRFDFSHGASVKDSEMEEIEGLVNEQVQANVVVSPAEMDLQEALRTGAMALFGEKYGDRVRVIRIGDFSTELCGGTHLDATGQIGLFKVTDEGAVASGVRRIEAVTGEHALAHVGREEAALRESAGLLKIPPLELPRRLAALLEDQKRLEKQLAQLETKLARSKAQDLVTSAKKVAGVVLLDARLDGLDPDGLRAVVDTLRDRVPSGIILLGSAVDGKVNLVASVSKDLTKRFPAGRLVQEVAKIVGGGGGGRPDLAQAGGKDASKLDEALGAAAGWVERTAQA